MSATNVVIYAVSHEGERRVLLSMDGDGVSAAKAAHAQIREFDRADRAGVPHPRIVAVQETRTGGADTNATARFVALDPDTLKPLVSGDKGVDTLEKIFAPKAQKETA